MSEHGNQIPTEYYKKVYFQKNFNTLNVSMFLTLIRVLNIKMYNTTMVLMILQY